MKLCKLNRINRRILASLLAALDTTPATAQSVSTAGTGTNSGLIWQPAFTRTGSAGEQNLSGATTPGTFTRSFHYGPWNTYGIKVVMGNYTVGVYTVLTETGLITNPGQGMFRVSGCTVASGGTGYVLGDLVTVPKDTTNMTAAICQVDQVAAGVVTKLSVAQPGQYYTQVADPETPTGGTGSGLTVNLTWVRSAVFYNIGIEPVWGTLAGKYHMHLGQLYTGANDENMNGSFGSMFVSDPLNETFAAGSLIGVDMYTMGSQMGYSRYGLTIGASANPGEFVVSGSASVLFNYAFGTTTHAYSNLQLVQPHAILGLVAPHHWAFTFGDSIACGAVPANSPAYDTGDAEGNIGILERGQYAVNNSVLVNICHSTDRYVYYMSTGSRTMRETSLLSMGGPAALAQATYLDEMGTNDVANGQTKAQLETNKINMFLELQALGIRNIITMTIFPQSSGTFTSCGGQTPSAESTPTTGSGQQLNADVRSGAFVAAAQAAGVTIPITVWDADSYAECQVSGAYTGQWIANYTTEGIHPDQTAIPIIAATFPVN